MDAVTGDIAGDGLIADIKFNRSAVLQVDVLRTGAQAERHDQRKDQFKDFLHFFYHSYSLLCDGMGIVIVVIQFRAQSFRKLFQQRLCATIAKKRSHSHRPL